MSAKGWILGIETSQPTGSVAIGRVGGDQEVDFEPFPIGLVHGREILPRIDTLFSRHPGAREELALIAVSAGPGSFTGVRIGVAAAKAIAWACKVPSLSVSSLEIIADNAVGNGDWRVLLDVRRRRCATATFRIEGDDRQRLTDDAILSWDEMLGQVTSREQLIGSGCRTIPGVENHPRGDKSWDDPKAAAVVKIARRRLLLIETGAEEPPRGFTSPHDLNPSYLEMSSAEEVQARAAGTGDR